MNNSKNGKINPDYYKSKIPGIECIDVVKYLDFPIGNAIKYLWRAGNKSYDNLDAKASAISDLEKAIDLKPEKCRVLSIILFISSL